MDNLGLVNVNRRVARISPCFTTLSSALFTILTLNCFFFQGMDAESYSLHTFEALLTQSMENLGEKTVTFFFSFFGTFSVQIFLFIRPLS